VHLGRLAREAENLWEKQRRHELGEEGTEDRINTSDFVDDDIDGQASRVQYLMVHCRHRGREVRSAFSA
jgi:hypothetical protein